MTLEAKTFESHFGFSFPQNLLEFLKYVISREHMPIKLSFHDNSPIVELQYFLDISNPDNYDIEKRRIKLAVTTDGFELWVDLNSENLDILQDEHGEFDHLGLSITDFANSTITSI